MIIVAFVLLSGRAQDCRFDRIFRNLNYSDFYSDQRSSVLAAVDKLVGLIEIAVQEAGELRNIREDIERLSQRFVSVSELPTTAAVTASSEPAQIKKSKVRKGAKVQATSVVSEVQVVALPSAHGESLSEAPGDFGSDNAPFVTVTRRKRLAPTAVPKVNFTNSSNKRRKNSKLIGSGADSELKTSLMYKFMHIFYVDKDIDEKCVEGYLKKKIPSEKKIIVERLPTGRQYASFKIGVPVGDFESVMKAEFWPAGIGFDRWFFRRNRIEAPTGQIKN